MLIRIIESPYLQILPVLLYQPLQYLLLVSGRFGKLSPPTVSPPLPLNLPQVWQTNDSQAMTTKQDQS